VDDITETEFEKLKSTLTELDFKYILHSSHSHNPTKEQYRVRVVFEINKPIAPFQAAAFRENFTRLLPVTPDKATKGLSHMYFLPTCPTHMQKHKIAFHGGSKPVSVDDYTHASIISLPVPGVFEARAREHIESEGVKLDPLREALKTVKSAASKDLVRRILRGLPLAAEGERDATIQRACGIVAFRLSRLASPETMLGLMEQSIRAMPGPPPEGMHDWMPVAREKLTRALKAKQELDAEEERFKNDTMRHLRIESAKMHATDVDDENINSEPYTDDEILGWALSQGCNSIQAFSKRWIIQKDRTFFVFINGRYASPIQSTELKGSLYRDLSRAPIELQTINPKNGAIHRKSVEDILHAHSCVARKIKSSYLTQESRYDETAQTFIEAICAPRKIRPIRHETIEFWLEMLAGDKLDLLLDSLSVFTQLDTPLPALCLVGPPGCGKSLLASGLARLWTRNSPTELSSIFNSQFNDGLASCPLVVSNEGLPDVPNVTSRLRDLLGTQTHKLRRMYSPVSELEGCIRLIITSNNDNIFKLHENLTVYDQRAVQQRLVFINCSEDATTLLNKWKNFETTRQWVDNDQIAEHATWLAATRKVVRGKRFLVSDDVDNFAHRTATNNKENQSVCEWIVNFLMDSKSRNDARLTQVLVGSDQLLVSISAMDTESNWSQRVQSSRLPPRGRLADAIKSISIGSVKLQIGDSRSRYHIINLRILEAWMEETTVGDVDLLRELVHKPNVNIELAKVKGAFNAEGDVATNSG
jgi:hypothetical protein